MDRGNCRDCKKPVRWVVSAASGNRMPLDTEPDLQRGNVLVTALGRAYVYRNHEAALDAQERTDDEYLAMSSTYIVHAATCEMRRRREPDQVVADAAPASAQMGLL